MQEGEGQWVTLREHEDDEIYSEYPNQIRRKRDKLIIKERVDKIMGYIMCNLNGTPFGKHRLVAIQFIPNPNQLPQVDHINHDRTDYHLSNLRWVTASDNSRNISTQKGIKYTFVNEISLEAIHVTKYSGYEFANLYYHENLFYYWNGIQYRILHIYEQVNGALVVTIRDVNGHGVTIYYSKFKREYDLI
jgi:hypothetical protein